MTKQNKTWNTYLDLRPVLCPLNQILTYNTSSMCQNWSLFHYSERYHGRRPTPETFQNWPQWKSTISVGDGKKKFLLCCRVLQYTERVRVPSGNVSGTNFPLQNVPQMFRQMWGTRVPSKSVWVSKSVSWMFLTLINLPCQAQKCLRWAVVATNGQKSAATFCAWGLFHFSGFQTSCFHMTLPVSIHILQIWFPPFCFTAWKEIYSRFFP